MHSYWCNTTSPTGPSVTPHAQPRLGLQSYSNRKTYWSLTNKQTFSGLKYMSHAVVTPVLKVYPIPSHEPLMKRILVAEEPSPFIFGLSETLCHKRLAISSIKGVI